MIQIDMEMPKSCYGCWIRLAMGCQIANASGWLNDRRDKICPLIEVPDNGGWISVKARLPEEDVDVLAYNGVVPFIAAYTTNPSKRWYTISGREIYPTHWMLLPEPPKKEKQE